MIRPLLTAALLCLPTAWAADTMTVTLLATTDLHGNILPYDYYTAKPAPRGLAKIATLIANVRRETPNTVLIDCGDTIQGAPIEGVYQHYVRTGKLPMGLAFDKPETSVDPMVLVMNHLRYDAMTVGNHEYNFGLKNFERARNAARFPWLSANTRTGGAVKPFAPYIVKNVGGVKIAIIGITTPAIPMWERPENYAGFHFAPGVEAATEAVRKLQATEKPDIIVAAVHAGLGRDIASGAASPGEVAGENMAYDVAAKVPGLHAVVFGHSHRQVDGARVNGVLMVQPKNWGVSLGRIDFRMEGGPGHWKLVESRAALLPAAGAVEDAEVMRLAKPYHEITERYLDAPVATADVALDGSLGRVQDSALVDAIHNVQLHYAKADVSFTSLFNTRVKVPQGKVTIRQIAALYLYDNELYTIEGDGKMVREALENSARYFTGCANTACDSGPGFNRNMAGYNFDMAQGVDYEIDLAKPEGQRVTKLLYKGKPLADTQKLRIAVNNYRAGGSSGYTMFRNQKIVWRSSQEIRDLIIEYYSEHGRLPSSADKNWKIVPAAAVTQLERAAQAEASRPQSQ